MSIKDKIQSSPADFDFVPALMQMWREANSNQEARRAMVGLDHFPGEEFVRFKVDPSFRQRAGEIVKLEIDEERIAEMSVCFIGLIGHLGVLPYHYTQLVIDRVKNHDFAMREFFDLFHHRIISNFFRASLKYQLAYNFEITQLVGATTEDLISGCLYSLAGYGMPTQRHAHHFDDESLVFFGGKFSRRGRTSLGLQCMLEDFTQLAVRVQQFQFEWLYLESTDQSRLVDQGNVWLGETTVLGERVQSIQNRIRIRLGPLAWNDFAELTPQRPRLLALAEFVKSYVGIGLDFDFQMVIIGNQIPPLILGHPETGRLGWSTWLCSQVPAVENDDAVFEVQLGKSFS